MSIDTSGSPKESTNGKDVEVKREDFDLYSCIGEGSYGRASLHLAHTRSMTGI